MCIAIYSPKGTEISAQSFRNCWDNNFNGAGFMYNDSNNKLRVVKEMESFSKIYKKYVAAKKKHPKANFVLHFRISTHGVINKSNCHPFKVNNELGFVHNGVIREVDNHKDYSDTNMFNRQILRKLPEASVAYFNNSAVKKVYGEFIGYSKLIFMNNKGEFAIVNEQKGHWADNVWYSNDSYKRVKNTVDYGGKTMTREEAQKLQGGSEANTKAIGYDYPSRYYDENSSSFNNTSRGWDNDTTIKDVSRNSNLGKEYGIYEGSNYLVSDGTITCDSCGIYSLTGELMSKDQECLECVSREESIAIASAAIKDGAYLENYGGTTVIDQETLPSADDEDLIECSYCTTVAQKSQTTHLADWGCTLCKSCTNDFVKDEALPEHYHMD